MEGQEGIKLPILRPSIQSLTVIFKLELFLQNHRRHLCDLLVVLIVTLAHCLILIRIILFKMPIIILREKMGVVRFAGDVHCPVANPVSKYVSRQWNRPESEPWHNPCLNIILALLVHDLPLRKMWPLFVDGPYSLSFVRRHQICLSHHLPSRHGGSDQREPINASTHQLITT